MCLDEPLPRTSFKVDTRENRKKNSTNSSLLICFALTRERTESESSRVELQGIEVRLTRERTERYEETSSMRPNSRVDTRENRKPSKGLSISAPLKLLTRERTESKRRSLGIRRSSLLVDTRENRKETTPSRHRNQGAKCTQVRSITS